MPTKKTEEVNPSEEPKILVRTVCVSTEEMFNQIIESMSVLHNKMDKLFELAEK